MRIRERKHDCPQRNPSGKLIFFKGNAIHILSRSILPVRPPIKLLTNTPGSQALSAIAPHSPCDNQRHFYTFPNVP